MARQIRTRMARAIDASGLTRDDYCARVHIRDAQAQALLDEALAELAAQHAREEALLHAFEASGQTVVPLPTCTADPRHRRAQPAASTPAQGGLICYYKI